MKKPHVKNYFRDMSDEEFSALDFNLFQRAIFDIAKKAPDEKDLGLDKIISRMNEFKVQDLITGK